MESLGLNSHPETLVLNLQPLPSEHLETPHNLNNPIYLVHQVRLEILSHLFSDPDRARHLEWQPHPRISLLGHPTPRRSS